MALADEAKENIEKKKSVMSKVFFLNKHINQILVHIIVE